MHYTNCALLLPQVPVSIIYGEHDWMDPRAGQRVAAAVARDRGQLSPTDCQVAHPAVLPSLAGLLHVLAGAACSPAPIVRCQM